MIDGLSNWPSVRLRHTNAPLQKEREQFLQHLTANGRNRMAIRALAAYLIHIVRIIKLTELRTVSISEIKEAGMTWAACAEADRRGPHHGVPDGFVRTAKQFLAFHSSLERAPVPSFIAQIENYRLALRLVQGLSEATIQGYSTKVAVFLRWLASRDKTLELSGLTDVLHFLESRRSSGQTPHFIAAQCQALRSFFTFAAIQGWCQPGISYGIRSPRLPRYHGPPRGPAWIDVRKLLQPSKNGGPKELRLRAILLLLSIYGLRSSEVARLQLDDFDWRNETFMVRRAKRGGIQCFPIQYEVGEAIISYLRLGRPPCNSRHLFIGLRPPFRAFRLNGMWRLVSQKMKQSGIESAHTGPHSLRHACATRLLKQGSSLQDIADFLGHRDIKAVGIYAGYDMRLLKQVAAFNLAGLR